MAWGSADANILTQNFTILAEIINVVALFMGVVLIFGGIHQFKRYGEQRTMMSSQTTMAGPLMMIIAGSILLILPNFIGASLLAFFGESSPLAYSGNSTGTRALIPPLLILVRVIGVAGFIRGVVLMARTGGQPNPPG